MRCLLAVIMCLALVGPAFADREGEAYAHVFVEVNPNVTVSAIEGDVDLGTVQTGTFQGYIPWRVDANTERVEFWAAASPLFKGDDPSDPETPPIPLDIESGIRIHIPDGGPVRGEDEYLDYVGDAQLFEFPGSETEAVQYESSQVGHLSQDVAMYVWWTQADPEKPIGEYSGVVRLSAMIVTF